MQPGQGTLDSAAATANIIITGTLEQGSFQRGSHTPPKRDTAACASGECINRRDRTAAPSKSYPQASQVRILPEPVTHQLWSSLKLCKPGKAEEFLQSHSHTGTKCNKTRLDCYWAARKDLEDGTRLRFSIQAKSDVRMPQLLSVLLVTAA